MDMGPKGALLLIELNVDGSDTVVASLTYQPARNASQLQARKNEVIEGHFVKKQKSHLYFYSFLIVASPVPISLCTVLIGRTHNDAPKPHDE